MSLNFPANPAEGQRYSSDGQTYVRRSGRWVALAYGEADELVRAHQIPGRNLLINGDFHIAQRATSVTGITGTTSGYRTVDRWRFAISSAGTWTMGQHTSAPVGLGYAARLSNTAAVTPSEFTYALFNQPIESQILKGLAKGLGPARELTLSFWVFSPVTGTFIVELLDSANNRTVSAAYTVSAANTWERKTVTFPRDVAGVLPVDNTVGLTLYFWLAAGSNYSSGAALQTEWGPLTAAGRAVGQTNALLAGPSNFYLAGIQLELGPHATPFDYRSIAEELALCQRYYFMLDHQVACVWNAPGANYGTGPYLVPPVTMRAWQTASFTNLQLANCKDPTIVARPTQFQCRVTSSAAGLVIGAFANITLDAEL